MLRTPVALIVLDGWGLSPTSEANAVALARTPNFDRYWREYPHTTLTASGEAVGLLPGQMGDSNVGHLNLGAGRIVFQTLVRIHKAVADGELARLPALCDAFARARRPGAALHLLGLCSDGGVHSHLSHLFALIDAARAAGVTRLYVHCFLDGRDVPPRSALPYIEAIEAKLAEAQGGQIATVCGRYFAMDRDKRWDRTQRAFEAIVYGRGLVAGSAREAVEAAYERGEGDEFVQPTVITDRAGAPVGVLTPDDAAFFFNFRADRGRQLSRALWESHFDGFRRGEGYTPRHLATMMQYDASLPIAHALPPVFITRPLGQIVSEAGLSQLRIAETEKYAHVTYFFNGGSEEVFPGEERVMVPSPKVSTYDLQPEMSAYAVAERAVAWIEGGGDVVILNFANPDMVGHTGVLTAAVRAVEAVDACLAQVVEAVRARGGAALIVADHGNADQMVDYETHAPHTNHTLNPVPCILVDDTRRQSGLQSGILANVAPTLLELIGLDKPPEMAADSLLKPDAQT